MSWLDGITDSMNMSLSKLRGNGEGQGSLVCCSLWVCKELDMTESLNNNKVLVPRVYICFLGVEC